MRALPIATTLLAFAAAATAESPFAGTWKQNRDRTQFDADSGVLKIEAEGSGIRMVAPATPSTVARSMAASVRVWALSPKIHSRSLKKGDRGYQAVQSRNGKPASARGGGGLHGRQHSHHFIHFARSSKGRKQQPTTVSTYNRTGGDGKPYPFIGTWRVGPDAYQVGEEPWPMIITESGGVLTMSNPVNDTKTIIDLNKSEVTVTGAFNPATDITRTAKRIDQDRSR